MSLYENLGVDASASQDEIKSAWRKKAQESHPDRSGGDVEKFQEIQKSYEILSDAERRDRYDKTGRTENNISAKDSAKQGVAILISQIIDRVNADYDDIIKIAVKEVENSKSQIKESIRQLEAKISRREVIKSRISGENVEFILSIIDREISQLNFNINDAKKSIECTEESLKILDGLAYRVEQIQGMPEYSDDRGRTRIRTISDLYKL
jgi:DnaJ-class molecular chaperone